MKKLVLLILLSLFGLSNLVGAEQSVYKQTRVNVRIRVLSFTDASADLRELISGFDGQIQNLNLDHDSSSGSSSIRISHNELPAFLEKLALIGSLEQQRQNTSDNSRNVADARMKLNAFKTLASSGAHSMFSKLDAEAKAVVLADYESWVRSRLSGAVNELNNYEEMSGLAQVDINFVKDEEPKTSAVVIDSTQSPLNCQPPESQNQSPVIFLLCLMNFLGLWLIYRRVERPVARMHD